MRVIFKVQSYTLFYTNNGIEDIEAMSKKYIHG